MAEAWKPRKGFIGKRVCMRQLGEVIGVGNRTCGDTQRRGKGDERQEQINLGACKRADSEEKGGQPLQRYLPPTHEAAARALRGSYQKTRQKKNLKVDASRIDRSELKKEVGEEGDMIVDVV